MGPDGRKNPQERAFQKNRGIKSKTIAQLFDRLMNRKAALWNDKEITTTLTASGNTRTAVGSEIWEKILRKTSMKKLVDKCGYFTN